MVDGLISMQTFIETKCPVKLKQCYFGLIVDNFKCDDAIQSTISLRFDQMAFYHVVDTPQTATEIITRFNNDSNAGEIHFFALSIFDRLECNENEPMTVDDDGNGGVLNDISFDPKFKNVFKFIYKETNVNGITDELSQSFDDFDYFFKDGAMCPKPTALHAIEYYHSRKQSVEMFEALKHDLRDNNLRLETASKCFAEAQLKLEQIQNVQTEYQTLKHKIESTKRQIEMYEKKIQAKKLHLDGIDAKIQELTKALNNFNEELKLPFLTMDENESVNLCSTTIEQKKHEQQLIIDRIKDIKSKRAYLKEHENTLRRRYSELEEQSTIFSNHVDEVEYQEQQCSQINDQLNMSSSQLSALQSEKVKMNEEIAEIKREMQHLNDKKRIATDKQAALYRQMNTLKIQKKTLTTERDKLISQSVCRNQTITNTDIIDMSETDVNCELNIARHQLKTFSKTNNFDLDLLTKFTTEKKELHRRRAELMRFEEKIVIALNKVDSEVDVAILNSFKDLSDWFTKIYLKFDCNRMMRMELIKSDILPDLLVHGEEFASKYAGLNVTLVNDEQSKQFADFSQLEKTIVALVFILSIQRTNPSPFYLFDCIDEVDFCIKFFSFSFSFLFVYLKSIFISFLFIDFTKFVCASIHRLSQ